MLLSALRQAASTGNYLPVVAAILASVFLVFFVIPVHEFAHAWMAYRLGDNTAKNSGGLTLNPLAHIDPLGAILIALIGFGWGKPTPINPNNFKNRRRGIAITSAAGPLSNLLFGWLFLFLGLIVTKIPALDGTRLEMILYWFFLYAGEISIYLAVLNLLPIPPFDGFGIVDGLLPRNASYWIATHQQTISLVVIVLLFTNVLTRPLSWIAGFIMQFFMWISSLPFG